MVYSGVSYELQEQVVAVAEDPPLVVKTDLIARLVTKLRSFVALNDAEAAVLRESLGEEGCCELIAVYGTEGMDSPEGFLEVRLDIPDSVFLEALPESQPTDVALEALHAVVHGVGHIVTGVGYVFDRYNNPPEAISLPEAIRRNLGLLQRAGSLRLGIDPHYPNFAVIAFLYRDLVKDLRLAAKQLGIQLGTN